MNGCPIGHRLPTASFKIKANKSTSKQCAFLFVKALASQLSKLFTVNFAEIF